MQLQPKTIGREFVRRYYTILNRSPENLHCFYNDQATFIHDDIDPMEQKTISVIGKQAICDVMKRRQLQYHHSCTIINGIDTVATINNGLVVQVFGEIAHNSRQLRPFSQSFVLMAVSPLKYYVLNEIFRFRDFLPGMNCTISETDSIRESSKASDDLNATFMDDANELMIDHGQSDMNVTPETSAEQMNELQTKHLKSMLQEAQSKDGRPPNYRKQIESAVTVAAAAPMKPISNETAKQLFQDKCIITIGSVINPNIKFDEEISTETEPKMQMVAAPKTEAATKSQRKLATKSPPNVSIETQTIVSDDSQQHLPTKSPPKMTNGTDENNNTIEEIVEQEVVIDVVHQAPEIVEDEEKMPIAETVAAESKPKSYAELLKLAREKSRSSSASSQSSLGDFRSGSFSSIKTKPLIIRNSLRRKMDKPSSTNRGKLHGNPYHIQFHLFYFSSSSTEHQSRSDNILQVFIGNIVQSASEEDIRRMFSKFGQITRFRIHSNPEKSWLPLYAFVTYENIDAVRRCLAKRNSLYYPENGPNRLKLNVNGDESIVLSDEETPEKNTTNADKTTGSNQQTKRRRDLKKFHNNFVISGTAKKEEPVAANKKVEMKTTKTQIETQAIKSRQLHCERIPVHGGRNEMRRIAAKAWSPEIYIYY